MRGNIDGRVVFVLAGVGLLGGFLYLKRMERSLEVKELPPPAPVSTVQPVQPAPPSPGEPLPVPTAPAAVPADAEVEKCLASRSPDEILRFYGQKSPAIVPYDVNVGDSLSYYACEAISAGDPKRCAPADSVKLGDLTLGRGCRGLFHHVPFMVAALRKDPAAKSHCRAYIKEMGFPVPADRLEQTCALMIASYQTGDIAALCNNYPPEGRGGCQADLAFLKGRTDACSGDLLTSGNCRVLAPLMAALRSGKLEDCGSSDPCRAVLAASSSSCVPARSRMQLAFCREHATRQAEALASKELQNPKVREYKKGEPMESIPLEVLKEMRDRGISVDPELIRRLEEDMKKKPSAPRPAGPILERKRPATPAEKG